MISSNSLPTAGLHQVTATTTLHLSDDRTFQVTTQTARSDIRLRKRKKCEPAKDQNKENANVNQTDKTCDENEVEKSELISMSDEPLNWFGFMAPSSLQHAQKNFKSVIERVVELSNLKRQLDESLAKVEVIKMDMNEAKKLSDQVELIDLNAEEQNLDDS